MPSSHYSSSLFRHILQESPQSSRGRRGRQARASQLSQNMLLAVRKFCRSVGAPNVVPPAGFRDFRGWLIRLNSKECRPIWDELIGTLAKDVSCDISAMYSLTDDIVREIVKCVVVPRPDESAKLVSTNAGRQASRPRSGTTLMIVLEQQISRLQARLPQLVQDLSLRSNSSSSTSALMPVTRLHQHSSINSNDHNNNAEGGRLLQSSSSQAFPSYMYSNGDSLSSGTFGSSWSNRQRASPSPFQRNPIRLPSIQDLLSDNQELSRPLPSFRELDASLCRRRTSPSRR